MEYLRIEGCKRLGGEIALHGAKNSVLPILCASVLIKGESVIHNCPKLSDVDVTVSILEHLGAKVRREGSTLIVDSKDINRYDVPKNLMQELRSSIIFLGALSTRAGRSCVYLPGGCDIGLRPIDMHISGMRSLGYSIELDENNICSDASKARAGRCVLPFPSVGATENLILSSVMLRGKTTIVNAAREPEIADLCAFLNTAGARISGASTPIIEIEGVERLASCEYTVMPDRILATTLMAVSAITASELKLNRARPSD